MNGSNNLTAARRDLCCFRAPAFLHCVCLAANRVWMVAELVTLMSFVAGSTSGAVGVCASGCAQASRCFS